MALVRPGTHLPDRRPGFHVRRVGRHAQRRDDPAAARGVGPGQGRRRVDRHRQPHRHGRGRVPVGHHRGPHRPQGGVRVDARDLLRVHDRGRADGLPAVVRAVPLRGRCGPGRHDPRGLRARGRVHPAPAARPRPGRDGRLVARRRRAVRPRLRLARGHVGRLAPAPAGHGPAGPARVRRAPGHPRVPAVPDEPGPRGTGPRRHRPHGGGHRRAPPALHDAPGRAGPLRRRRRAARRGLAVLPAHHRGRLGPVRGHHARLLHRAAVAADVPHRRRLRGGPRPACSAWSWPPC